MNRLKIHVITFTFLRYANFSKLMRTIHTSMASTFQFEYWHCFTFKGCNKLHNETYQSWRYARQNSECYNAVIHPKRLFFCYFFKKKLKLFRYFVIEYHLISYLCLLLSLFACVGFLFL